MRVWYVWRYITHVCFVKGKYVILRDPDSRSGMSVLYKIQYSVIGKKKTTWDLFLLGSLNVLADINESY